MTSDSQQLMRTYLQQVVQAGRLELIDELAHDDVVDEANQAFAGPPGRAGLIAHAKGFRRNIDDVDVTIHRIVGNDREVMAWWSFTGVHVGPWLNQPPTQQAVTGTVFSFFDLVDGKISRYQLWLHAGFETPIVFSTAPQDD